MLTARLRNLNPDFWKFWTGQVISNLGSSFTMFAVPLLIFKLTHSAVNLGLSMAAAMLPYLFFGLIIGAWVDRLNRKRLMIVVNVGMALTVGSIPYMAHIGHLSIWWIYGATFVEQTLAIFFTSAEFAAIP
ncbi:MAG TPA: MFS transporter, partial [Chloroflexota bacterium]